MICTSEESELSCWQGGGDPSRAGALQPQHRALLRRRQHGAVARRGHAPGPHHPRRVHAGQGRRPGGGGGGGGVTPLIVVNHTNDVFPTEHDRNTMDYTEHKELH